MKKIISIIMLLCFIPSSLCGAYISPDALAVRAAAHNKSMEMSDLLDKIREAGSEEKQREVVILINRDLERHRAALGYEAMRIAIDIADALARLAAAEPEYKTRCHDIAQEVGILKQYAEKFKIASEAVERELETHKWLKVPWRAALAALARIRKAVNKARFAVSGQKQRTSEYLSRVSDSVMGSESEKRAFIERYWPEELRDAIDELHPDADESYWLGVIEHARIDIGVDCLGDVAAKENTMAIELLEKLALDKDFNEFIRWDAVERIGNVAWIEFHERRAARPATAIIIRMMPTLIAIIKGEDNTQFSSYIAMNLLECVAFQDNVVAIDAVKELLPVFVSIMTDKKATSNIRRNAMKTLGAAKPTDDIRARFREVANDPATSKDARKFLSSALDLGISWFGRFQSCDNLLEIVQNRIRDKKDRRPLAVMIYPTGDWNKSLLNPGSIDSGGVIYDLVRKGYRVMYYEVSDLEGMISAVKLATKLDSRRQQKATLIAISAHARKDIFVFSETGIVELSPEVEAKLQCINGALEDEGIILANMCEAGEGRAEEDNNANLFLRVFPQAQAVMALTERGGFEGLWLGANGKIVSGRSKAKIYYATYEGLPDTLAASRVPNPDEETAEAP